MDILDRYIDRLRNRVFPVVQSDWENTLRSMLQPQMERLPVLTALEKVLLEDAIIRRYEWATVSIEEPVGINAALTVGENQVQSSLQSHHHAGLGVGAKGFARIMEITNMKNQSDIVKVVTTPIQVRIRNPDGGDTITYEVPRSKKDIHRLANGIMRVLLSHVVKDYEIVSGLHPEWYRTYIAISNVAGQLLRFKWLRIHMDPERLYRHGITVPGICALLTDTLPNLGAVLYAPVA